MVFLISPQSFIASRQATCLRYENRVYISRGFEKQHLLCHSRSAFHWQQAFFIYNKLCYNGISTVIPESSFTLSSVAVISVDRIFGGGFLSEFLSRNSFIPPFQFLVYPNRISAKIQNCKNLGGSGRFAVVDSEWKSFREQAMESKIFGMDSVEKSQALDVGEDGVFKIISNANFLQVVKFAPALDVLCGFFEDNEAPNARFDARRALSSGIVRNFPSPASTFAKRSERTSPCQSGDESLSSDAEKERQSSSIACRRSIGLMLLISDSAKMGQL
jgi:hypothetical protein